jgi:hypothetical protein
MRLRGPAKGTTAGSRGPALAALPSGAVRRHVLFAALSIVALAYFQRQVPETKNRSLPDIERGLDLPARDALARTGS